MQKLKHLARYLIGNANLEIIYEWGAEKDHDLRLDIYTDSDWAGCKRTRRSSSGGVVMHGSHTIKHWSRMQASVALSSAEAELYACNKAAAECLGMAYLCNDFLWL